MSSSPAPRPRSVRPTLRQLETELRSTTRFGRLLWQPSVSSTQDLAATTEPLADDLAVWADQQTAGRGRRGRRWSGAAGEDVEVTFRCVGRPGPSVRLAAAMPAAVAAEIEQECERQGAPLRSPLRVKWPNDLLIRGRKCCGLLIDAASDGGGDPDSFRILIGVGVDANRRSFPSDLADLATSLAAETGPRGSSGSGAFGALGGEFDRGGLLLAIARGVERALRALEQGGGEERERLGREFGERLLGSDLPTSVHLHVIANGSSSPDRDGERRTARGADLDGLLLEAGSATERVEWARVDRLAVMG